MTLLNTGDLKLMSNQQALKIAPSILSADFSNLQHTVQLLQQSGADLLHLDIMDGIFVPNLSFGPKMVADLKKHTRLTLDVHLMVGRPERLTAAVAEAGADMISFHIESTDREYVVPMLRDIKRRKLKAGLAISPDTPIKALTNCLDSVDYVVLMSVYPGASGQFFLEKTFERLQQLRALIGEREIEIEIDGGINLQNIAQIKSIGVDIAVAGSAIISSGDWQQAIVDLKEKQLDDSLIAEED